MTLMTLLLFPPVHAHAHTHAIRLIKGDPSYPSWPLLGNGFVMVVPLASKAESVAIVTSRGHARARSPLPPICHGLGIRRTDGEARTGGEPTDPTPPSSPS